MLSTISQIESRLKETVNDAVGMFLTGDLEGSLRLLDNTRSFFEGSPEYLRRHLCGVGMTCMGLGLHERAKDAYREALSLPAGSEYEVCEAAAIKGNLASTLIRFNQTEEAHKLVDEAIETLTDTIHGDWLGDKWECKARIFIKEERFLEGALSAKKAVDILWEACDVDALDRAIRTLSIAFAECKSRGLFHAGSVVSE